MKNKYLTTFLLLVMSLLTHNGYAAEIGAANKIKANQYIKCAVNSTTTGAIKTAFNQQSDRESQTLYYVGAAIAMYAGWLTTTEYALSIYKEEQLKLWQVSQQYIRSGSRDEIYKFTVSYLAPKNEKCVPLMKEVQASVSNPDSGFHEFKKTQVAKQLMKDVWDVTAEMVIGKNAK